MESNQHWFSFDGENFEKHRTEAEARNVAEMAMDDWSAFAADRGWDPLSTQVCYGKITHSVSVERTPVTDEDRHLVPTGCDDTEFEHHTLVPIQDEEFTTTEGDS